MTLDFSGYVKITMEIGHRNSGKSPLNMVIFYGDVNIHRRVNGYDCVAIRTGLFIAAVLFAKTPGPHRAFRSMALCALLLGTLAVAAAQKTERWGG